MDNDRRENDAPPELIHALRQLRPKGIPVPRSVDNAVLKAARRGLRPPAVPWWATPSLPNWARVSVLAACFLAAFLLFLFMPARFAREDVNRDRLVNILDAFQLARELRAGTPLPSRFDFNGDGRVNQADVDAVAARAVQLERNGRL